VTEKFVEYLAYKTTYENVNPNEEIPDFFERIAPEIALELCVLKKPFVWIVILALMNRFLVQCSLSAADYLEGTCHANRGCFFFFRDQQPHTPRHLA
jgi:hypothetical protein